MSAVFEKDKEKNLSDSIERETHYYYNNNQYKNVLSHKSVLRGKGEKREKDTHTLSEKLKKDYPEIFNLDNQILKSLLKIKENFELIELFDEVIAMTVSKFNKYALTAFEQKRITVKSNQRLIQSIFDQLYLLDYIGFHKIKTRKVYKDAVVYFIINHPLSEIRINKWVDYYMGLNIEEKDKESDVQFKARMKHKWQLQSEAAAEMKKEKPLSMQEKAKVVLAADQISVHSKNIEKERDALKKHSSFCTTCEAAFYSGNENKCYEFHKIRQRFNRLSKTVVETIAKYPDKITSKVNDLENIKSIAEDITKQVIPGKFPQGTKTLGIEEKN